MSWHVRRRVCFGCSHVLGCCAPACESGKEGRPTHLWQPARLIGISNELVGFVQELTRSTMQPMGGTAYLSLENSEDPYLHGVKFSAMPPTKRFREMEQLSGGEKVRICFWLCRFRVGLSMAKYLKDCACPAYHSQLHDCPVKLSSNLTIAGSGDWVLSKLASVPEQMQSMAHGR